MKNSISNKILVLALLLVTSCGLKKVKVSKVTTNTTSGIENIFNQELGIETVPEILGKEYTKNFERYTKVLAPNGKPIHIVIQDDITDGQAVRCRGILEHFLKDYPGSKYGNDKSAIANKMAENNAVLALMNGQDDGKTEVRVNAQSLFKNEIQVEGHSWYTNQNYEHRDAAYEEILHFVHDNGIGVDGPNTMPGAAPELQKEIRAAQVNGLANKLWADNERAKDWIEELAEENSLSQEYLAAVIDVYYGLWGAFDENAGMGGLYVAKVRDAIKTKDAMAYELMNNKFFHPYITYNARIDSEFKGVFSLKFDESIPYTHHARYLKDITLLGNNDTNVLVNQLDNDITGNEGINTVFFPGNSYEYEILTKAGMTTVKDNTQTRNGQNTLRNIEKLQFADKSVDL
ncbi:hypothetical protein [Maribacter antarcticus]|uniref:hypothetical protein n=1 Tax=Maribacter antarcticus TaxID=505250 RepID=UPI00055D34E1|nr:hypothetical protein [Maribacter antarcticus]